MNAYYVHECMLEFCLWEVIWLTECSYLPEEDAVRPYVALGGEDPVSDRLEGHPLQRQTSIRQLIVLVAVVNKASQTEVTQLDDLILTDEHVTSGQVTMNVLPVGKKLLR